MHLEKRNHLESHAASREALHCLAWRIVLEHENTFKLKSVFVPLVLFGGKPSQAPFGDLQP